MAIFNYTIVSIRFSAKGLDPKKMAGLLDFTESDATESIIKHRENGRVVWSVSINKHEPAPIEEKLLTLLGMFTDDISAWKSSTENVKADVFCGLFLDGFNQGFSLSPKVLKMLADRDLEIGFDAYAPMDPWDEWTAAEGTE